VTYLRRIARSTLIDWLRARRAMKRDWTTERTLDISDEAGREYFELEAKCPKPSPYDATHSRELRRRFRRECWTSANTRQTAARDAWITERMVVDGWSCREAATAVELAPATVSSVLTRMRRELRRRGLLVPARLNSRL